MTSEYIKSALTKPIIYIGAACLIGMGFLGYQINKMDNKLKETLNKESQLEKEITDIENAAKQLGILKQKVTIMEEYVDKNLEKSEEVQN